MTLSLTTSLNIEFVNLCSTFLELNSHLISNKSIMDIFLNYLYDDLKD